MKNCELCKFQAICYCESDEANLCWACDAKVHGANFLVARHSRTLLCRTCQSLTPWKASGAKLGRTVSVCDRCVNEVHLKEGEDDEESEADNEQNDDDLALDDEDEADADNQVVPWSSSTTPPPAASSSSSSSYTTNQECVSRFACVDEIKSVKRSHESSTDPKSSLEDNINGASSQWRSQGGGGDGDVVSVDSSRPLKERRTETERPVPVNAGSRSGATIKTAERFYERCNGKLKEESEDIDEKLTRNISRKI